MASLAAQLVGCVAEVALGAAATVVHSREQAPQGLGDVGTFADVIGQTRAETRQVDHVVLRQRSGGGVLEQRDAYALLAQHPRQAPCPFIVGQALLRKQRAQHLHHRLHRLAVHSCELPAA